MGLSTKQVSGDHGLDWSQALLQAQSFELPKPPAMMRRQQNQEQPEQLKCPRCESTNTKFCYYNNYNKTQPRHFCRACKRHWTKGGTLRNVPVGGHGRKNKRARKSSSAAKNNSSNGGASTTNIASTTRLINSNTNLSFDMGALLPPQINSISSSELDNHVFSSSGLSSSNLTTNLPFNFFQAGGGQVLSFPFSSSSTTSSSFDTISTSFQSPNVYNYAQEFQSMEEPTATLTTSTIITQPINVSSGGMDAPNDNWNWEDIETLVSTDLNVPWGDSDVNP